METKEYTTIDRTGWRSGAWDKEPDKVQWQDEKTGLPCLAVRHPSFGNWCGYVGISEDHPDYRKSYELVDDIEVHYGLTFSDSCRHGEEESTGICHIPSPGESDSVWWLGFDCGHCYDDAPGLYSDKLPRSKYRTLAYVKDQCASLADQLNKRASHENSADSSKG